MSIAQTILEQLGGNRFIVMTGASNFTDYGNALQFKLPRGFAGNRSNLVRIELDTASDLYTMTFSRYFKLQVTTISTHERLQWDDLRRVFTEQTGLDTKL